jgi:hypothetical protein
MPASVCRSMSSSAALDTVPTLGRQRPLIGAETRGRGSS